MLLDELFELDDEELFELELLELLLELLEELLELDDEELSELLELELELDDELDELASIFHCIL